MPHRTMYKDDLCKVGSEGSDSEMSTDTAFDNGLDAMERDGWTLLQVIPQHRTWNDEGVFEGHNDLSFIFHKPPSGQSRLLA